MLNEVLYLLFISRIGDWFADMQIMVVLPIPFFASNKAKPGWFVFIEMTFIYITQA